MPHGVSGIGAGGRVGEGVRGGVTPSSRLSVLSWSTS